MGQALLLADTAAPPYPVPPCHGYSGQHSHPRCHRALGASGLPWPGSQSPPLLKPPGSPHRSLPLQDLSGTTSFQPPGPPLRPPLGVLAGPGTGCASVSSPVQGRLLDCWGGEADPAPGAARPAPPAGRGAHWLRAPGRGARKGASGQERRNRTVSRGALTSASAPRPGHARPRALAAVRDGAASDGPQPALGPRGAVRGGAAAASARTPSPPSSALPREPVPREGELCPWGHRAQLHSAPSEEQGPAGLQLHGDLHGCQWVRGDGAAARAGPLLLPGPCGGAPGLSRQPQHLCRPQDQATLKPTAHPAPAPLRGFFQVGSDLRLIEPLDEGGEGGRHAVYQAEHLLQTAGTCGVSDDSLGSLLGPRTAAVFRPQPGGSLPSRETRYVELYVVADNAEFQMLGSEAAVRRRVLEVVNHVDKLYQKLNFRVVLVGLEIWNRQDKFHVSPHPNVTLENLLAWQARRLTQRHLQDNVQLITGVDFTGTTVGLARVSAMCSHSSGAVNQDHSKNPVGVACTMAHEMGHNLGMDHDENVQGCRCRERSEAGRCIMAGSIGSTFPRMFSDCSQAYLEGFLEQPQSACLANAPDLSHLVGGPVCGNLFVERGEQCDCGPPEVRPHPVPAPVSMGCHDFCPFRSGPPSEFVTAHPECPETPSGDTAHPALGGYCYNRDCPTLAAAVAQAFAGARWAGLPEESALLIDHLPGRDCPEPAV
ncbi:PREDICTED: disintegrin and metalloproteinase domain-containing protein 8-like [Rhinopithecus bieti]|uniref:disintegrin and metalloproteinase domain-containing protein 8-like n=1 Tax=Rhinopithecus bieti TaxID=61621 RepID=UPI00083C663F|nr:PREDICTED: disintegrin and metalloproteinase domain-containing protein 8-like [Rhinopithecus bieti]